MKKLTTLAFSSCFLLGCAIKPVSNEIAKSVPSKRINDSTFFVKQSDKILVTIKRDQGHVGSACTTKILIDGHAVAGLRMSEKMEVYLSPEQHIISSLPQGVCGGGIAELQIDLSSKTTATYRVGYDGNATHKIQPTVF